MTVIRQGVNKVGEFWIKKTFQITLDDDGQEHPIAVLAFPAYTFPGYTWLNWSIIGASEMNPWASSEMVMNGRHVNVPEGLTFADNMQDLMELYAPIDEASAGGSTTVTQTNVAITGQKTHILEGSKAYTFLDREYKFGLASNAYPTNASKIRYHASGQYAGHCKVSKMVDINQPSMIFIGGLTEAQAVQSDQSTAVYGDHTDFGDLYNSLMYLYKGTPVGDQSSDMMDTALLNYQGAGFYLEDGADAEDNDNAEQISNDDDLFIKMDVTCRMDVYEPKDRSSVLAP